MNRIIYNAYLGNENNNKVMLVAIMGKRGSKATLIVDYDEDGAWGRRLNLEFTKAVKLISRMNTLNDALLYFFNTDNPVLDLVFPDEYNLRKRNDYK